MDNKAHEWLETFTRFWSNPHKHFELLLLLFTDDISLMAPGLPRVRGMRRALMLFEQMLKHMPDLTATVERSALNGDAIFIEMTFSASIAGETFRWKNVDRFLLQNGRASERQAFFDPTELQSRLAVAATP